MLLPVFIFIAVLFTGSFFWLWWALPTLLPRGGAVMSLVPPSFELAVAVLSIVLPLFLLWLIVIVFYFVYITTQQQQSLFSLASYTKRSSDHLEVTARHLVEMTQQMHATEFLQRMSVVFSDLSEILVDIVTQSHWIADNVLSKVWDKTGENKLWILCQLVLDVADRTVHFSETLRRQLKKNEELKGSILKFLSRYDKLVQGLRHYDKEKILVTFIEEGVVGRVASIFSQVLDASRRHETLDESDDGLQRSIFSS